MEMRNAEMRQSICKKKEKRNKKKKSVFLFIIKEIDIFEH